MWFSQNSNDLVFIVKQDKWVSIYKWMRIEDDNSWIISVGVLSFIVVVVAAVYVYYSKKVKKDKSVSGFLLGGSKQASGFLIHGNRNYKSDINERLS